MSEQLEHSNSYQGGNAPSLGPTGTIEEFEASDRKVFVAIRIRPCLQGQGERYEAKCVRRTDDRSVACTNLTDKSREVNHAFAFDAVFEEGDDQEVIYTTCVSELTSMALDGGDVTVMAYGQTGSGKTHTLLGERLISVGGVYTLHPNSGMFLRTVADLLDHRDRCAANIHVVLCLTVIEIYQDQFRDLLSNKASVGFREFGDDLTLLNQTIVELSCLGDVVRYFDIAYKNRAVAATLLNDESSRSHAMFFIDILQQAKTASTPHPPDPRKAFNVPKTETQLPYMTVRSKRSATPPTEGPTGRASARDPYPVTKSRITFVDLAGSERIKRSGVAGQQLTEALFVNKSLSTLGNVVNNIHLNAKHIPFRDSKMTRILRSSFLSANSRIVFITTIGPTNIGLTETLGSLRFADRLKSLRPPTSTDPRVGSETAQETEYLAKLRLYEELAADVRIASVCAGYVRQLSTHSTNSYVRDRDIIRNILSQYRREVQQREESEKNARTAELNGLIQEIVSAHTDTQPEQQADKKRMQTLLRMIEEEEERESAHTGEVRSLTQETLALVATDKNSACSETLSDTLSKLQRHLLKAEAELEEVQASVRNAENEVRQMSSPERAYEALKEGLAHDISCQKKDQVLWKTFQGLKSFIAIYHGAMIQRSLLPAWTPQLMVSPLAFHFESVHKAPPYSHMPMPQGEKFDSDVEETHTSDSQEPTEQLPLVTNATPVNPSAAPPRRRDSVPTAARRSRSTAHYLAPLRERLSAVLDGVERSQELGNDDVRNIFGVLDELRVDTEQLEKDILPRIGSDVMCDLSIGQILNYATGSGEMWWASVGRMLQAVRLYPESPLLINQTATAIRSAALHKRPMSVPQFVEVLVMENRAQKERMGGSSN